VFKQQITHFEALIKEHKERSERDEKMIVEMTDAQLKMKSLIDQERELYNEDREKLEEDLNKIGRLAEAKIRLIMNKLLSLYDGNFDGDIGVEEIIDKIAIRLTKSIVQE
jgi:mevalonate kinase